MADHLFRENSGKMVAVLTRIFGLHQIDRVLDIVQDTFESALVKWKYNGVPQNPGGWLMQAAKNHAINTFKRENKTISFSSSSFIKDRDESFELNFEKLLLPPELEDSQLRLLLICCHPDFSEKNQVIITLHVLCGFGVSEIANALIMNDEAVKKALFRMKAEFREMNNILETPLLPSSEKRLDTVHTILYLMFNEGYKTTRSPELINNELCYEAMRLLKLLLKQNVALHEESNALMSLMFFNLSRFPSRLNSEGEIISLEEQDRSKWNKVFIEEGYFYLHKATKAALLSRYHLEAIIASVHCTAHDFADTDWKRLVYLYEQLLVICPSPMLTLNKLVAESYVLDSRTALRKLGELKKQNALKDHYLLHAVEGDILRRAGNSEKAKEAFNEAYNKAVSPLDKQFLKSKLNKFRS